MSELTDKRIAFAMLYVENGGNATQAAKGAGYSHKGAKVEGHRLLKDERVQELIVEESRKLAVANVPACMKVLRDLMKNSKDEKIKLTCAKELAALGGMQAMQIVEMRHKVDTRTDEEIRADAIKLAKELGLPLATHDAPEQPQ